MNHLTSIRSDYRPGRTRFCECLVGNATITHVLPRRMIDTLRLLHRSAGLVVAREIGTSAKQVLAACTARNSGG